MFEMRENELLAERQKNKRDHLLNNSPSVLDRVTRVFAKKKKAALSLQEIEIEEAEALEQQRRYVQLLAERSEIERRLLLAATASTDLQSGIKGWQIVIADHLFAHDAHALDRSAHAAIQVMLLRARLELLPAAVKELKTKQATIKAEITALEKAL